MRVANQTGGNCRPALEPPSFPPSRSGLVFLAQGLLPARRTQALTSKQRAGKRLRLGFRADGFPEALRAHFEGES